MISHSRVPNEQLKNHMTLEVIVVFAMSIPDLVTEVMVKEVSSLEYKRNQDSATVKPKMAGW